jgi:hypothetical protein
VPQDTEGRIRAENALKQKEVSLRAFGDLILGLLLTLSTDEIVVQDACQKLDVLMKRDPELIRANSTLASDLLASRLASWTPGNRTRQFLEDLLRGIEQIRLSDVAAK